MSYEDYEPTAHQRHVCGETAPDWECDVDHECAKWICRACATALQREMDVCSDACALRKVRAMHDELRWMSAEIRQRRIA